MFLKQTKRLTKEGKPVIYLSLVESVWDTSKQAPAHKPVYKFGRDCPEVRESLIRLIQSIGRFLYLDQTMPDRTIEAGGAYGPVYLLRHLWKNSGLELLVARALKNHGIDPLAESVLFGWMTWLVLSQGGEEVIRDSWQDDAPIGEPSPYDEDLNDMEMFLTQESQNFSRGMFERWRSRRYDHDGLCVIGAVPVSGLRPFPFNTDTGYSSTAGAPDSEDRICFLVDLEGQVSLFWMVQGSERLSTGLAETVSSVSAGPEETRLLVGGEDLMVLLRTEDLRNAGIKTARLNESKRSGDSGLSEILPRALLSWQETTGKIDAALSCIDASGTREPRAPFSIQALPVLLTLNTLLDAEVREKAGIPLWDALRAVRSLRVLTVKKGKKRPPLLSAPNTDQIRLLRSLEVPVPGMSSRGRPFNF
ncbi:hypothetical protein ACFLU6_10545 [Acidobacteriota bacterium]